MKLENLGDPEIEDPEQHRDRIMDAQKVYVGWSAFRKYQRLN